MAEELLEAIKERIKAYITHRLFIVSIVMIVLFAVLVKRLFKLQIIEGEEHMKNFTYKIERSLPIDASRGNIYDSNGNILAYNKLVYSVTFGNSAALSSAVSKQKTTENELKNRVVYETLKVLEKNGDHIVNDFNIKLNDKGGLEYKIEGQTLKRFIADVYAVNKYDELDVIKKNSSAEELFEYMCSKKLFDVDESYTKEEALDIVAVRYKLWLNRFQQYVPVKVALDVSKKSMAEILERKNELLGMDIIVDSIRQYNDSKYFAHIIGYIGSISSDEMEEVNAELEDDEKYVNSDKIGKAGIEKEMEAELRGRKGIRKLYVDNLGRVLETIDVDEATSGNDIHLSIDSDLQKYIYHAIEKELAGIILANLTPGTEDKTEKGEVLIPIHKAYFALFNNNVLSLSHMNSEDASAAEKSCYKKIMNETDHAINKISGELKGGNTPIETLSDAMKKAMYYIHDLVADKGIIDYSVVDSKEDVAKDYKADKNSLGELLRVVVTKGGLNMESFEINTDYYTSEELYDMLVDRVIEMLKDDDEFQKIIIEDMVKNQTITNISIAGILYDQNILNREKDSDYTLLHNGTYSGYEFMRAKIEKLELTPAQLGLDPCSGSVVVTDVNTGKVKAIVSYPSYDNNMLTNSINADYYNMMLTDKTTPLYSRATQQRTAPGSTFKMVTTAAAVSEGKLGVHEEIQTLGLFDKIVNPAKCWIYRDDHRTHGTIDIEAALEKSCNYFYYECGYRLSCKNSKDDYNDARGLEKLTEYARMFGLGDKSGIEMAESEPKISDTDAVRSAIGQGTHNYTASQLSRYVSTLANSGTCYNLSIIDNVTDSSGNVIDERKSTVFNKIDLDKSLWDAIHNGMRRVVTDHTDKNALINRLNVKVAGKTGTAQESKNRSSHSLFVSYAPFEEPEVSVTVQIPFGYSSGNAEELASFIYAYMYDPDKLENADVTGDSGVSD